MPETLTDAQAEVLEQIRGFYERDRIPPTMRQIGNLLGGRSPSTVHAHVMALERKGYLERRGRMYLPTREEVA